MTGRIATLVLGAFVFATPAVASASGGVVDDRAVVRIWGSGSCTAFLVRPSVFLTAKHCVQGPGASGRVVPEVDIRFHHDDTRSPTYDSMPGIAVRSAPGAYTGDDDIDGHDFGVFESSVPFREREPGVAPLAIYRGDPRVLLGEEVYLLGFGERHGRFALTRANTRIRAVGDTIVVDPAVACFGDSGGPLIRASTGEVIGLASREWPTGRDACAAPKGERSIFQRIDAYAWMIDEREALSPLPGPARITTSKAIASSEADTSANSDTDGGCSVSTAPRASDFAGTVLAGLALLVLRRRAVRRAQSH